MHDSGPRFFGERERERGKKGGIFHITWHDAQALRFPHCPIVPPNITSFFIEKKLVILL